MTQTDREMIHSAYKGGNPGSTEAIGNGCKCPVIDNGRGRGSGGTDENGNPLFWIVVGCPLHDPKLNGQQ